MAPADVVFGPRNAVEPDLFVVPLVGGVPPRAWQEVGRLLLTVEVLSPSTLRADRGEKRDLYQRKGVPEYWIVDVDSRRVDRWRSDATEPETLSEAVAWQPDRFVPPLVIDLHEYFTRVTGVSSVHGYTSPRLEGNGPPQAVHGRATWCTRRAPLRPSAVDQLLAGSLSSGSNRTPSRC